MNGHASILELRTRHTFTIARGGADVWRNVAVEWSEAGRVHRGEGAPRSYYDETPEAAMVWLHERLARGSLPGDPRALRDERGPASARAALDNALHDAWAAEAGLPLHEDLELRYGLVRGDLPKSSFTIGIDEPVAVAAKTREAAAYPILKVKLGTERDFVLLEAIRSESDAVLRVDANAAWTVEETLEKAPRLADLGVELIEQPLPKSDLEGYRSLHGRCALPIYADESCVGPADVERLQGAVDGINIKLSKCGGLEPAARMIRRARELGMQIMVGCFIESSLGITAAAHLAPFVDVLDLDGAALLDIDPFRGATIDEGIVRLPEGPGLGVVPAP